MIFLFSHSFSYSDSFRFFPPLFLSFLSHCLHLFLSISFIPSLSLYYSVSFSSCFFISLSFAPSLSFQLPLSSLFFYFLPSFYLLSYSLFLLLTLSLSRSLSLSLSFSLSPSVTWISPNAGGGGGGWEPFKPLKPIKIPEHSVPCKAHCENACGYSNGLCCDYTAKGDCDITTIDDKCYCGTV